MSCARLLFIVTVIGIVVVKTVDAFDKVSHGNIRHAKGKDIERDDNDEDYLLDDIVGEHLEDELQSVYQESSDTTDEAFWPSAAGNSLCPPPSRPFKSEDCNSEVCHSDEECNIKANGTKRACCYTGCVYSCVTMLEPPPFFDWVEETPKEILEYNSSTLRPQQNQNVKSLFQPARAPEESIVLPGGCLVTSQQYHDLEDFRQKGHVENCFCEKGSILCEVRHDEAIQDGRSRQLEEAGRAVTISAAEKIRQN